MDKALDEEKAWTWQVWRRVAVDLERREIGYLANVAREYAGQREKALADGVNEEDISGFPPDRMTSINPAFQTAEQAFGRTPRADAFPVGPTIEDAGMQSHPGVADGAAAALTWRPPAAAMVRVEQPDVRKPQIRVRPMKPMTPAAMGYPLTRTLTGGEAKGVVKGRPGSSMDALVEAYLKEKGASESDIKPVSDWDAEY